VRILLFSLQLPGLDLRFEGAKSGTHIERVFLIGLIVPFSLLVERGNFRCGNIQGEHVWCRVAISWTMNSFKVVYQQ
jgi:hypothetical protein